MARTRKALESEKEKMTDANIAKVISLLSSKEDGAKPITKKDACAILGMAYNTTRLASIIEKYNERMEYAASRRASLRGKPLSNQEVVFAVEAYLEGDSIDSIAKSMFRSAEKVKTALKANGVPFRPATNDYFNPELVPDKACKERFNIGDKVYSVKYNATADVVKEEFHKDGYYAYRVWLLGDENKFAYTPAYELASLEHLKELGVKV